jgi:DNA-binding response OmpR family regulator
MKSVLVVEDDFDTLHPLAELLSIKGYKAYTASEGAEALRLAERLKPDLIITDIILPGESGLQLIKHIRTSTVIATTPIIVISGCEASVLDEASRAGASVCLEKPIHPDRFWAAFETIIHNDTSNGWEPPIDCQPAREIEWLIQQLRLSNSEKEREDYLFRLKARILAARSGSDL